MTACARNSGSKMCDGRRPTRPPTLPAHPFVDLFVLFFIHETKGKALEELEGMLLKRKQPDLASHTINPSKAS